MNCHGNQNENNGSHKHSNLKHLLHMVLCCGIPVLIIVLLPLIGRLSPGIASVLRVIAPFICPVMMIGMMVMMMKTNKHQQDIQNTPEKQALVSDDHKAE